MAKTFKKLPKQNLLRIPVLIEDTKSYSEYFEISELNRIFHAGKNGFLIRGSDFLAQNTDISIEVLDRFDSDLKSTLLCPIRFPNLTISGCCEEYALRNSGELDTPFK